MMANYVYIVRCHTRSFVSWAFVMCTFGERCEMCYWYSIFIKTKWDNFNSETKCRREQTKIESSWYYEQNELKSTIKCIYHYAFVQFVVLPIFLDHFCRANTSISTPSVWRYLFLCFDLMPKQNKEGKIKHQAIYFVCMCTCAWCIRNNGKCLKTCIYFMICIHPLFGIKLTTLSRL